MAYLEHIEVENWSPEGRRYPLTALGIFQDKTLSKRQQAFDEYLEGGISECLADEDFRGEKGQTEVLFFRDGKPVRRILLIGLGEREKFTLDGVRQAAGVAVRTAQQRHIGELAVELFGGEEVAASEAEQARAAAEGLTLGSYQFTDYKTVDTEKIFTARKATILAEPGVSEAVRRGQITAKAGLFVRDLAHHPSNILTPTRLAEEAEQIAKIGGFKYRVYNRDEFEKMGMGALAGVARGSAEPPKFIVLEYNGGKKDDPPVAFVGKGITFDSGGISLKPSKKMDDMKFDMCGAAAVLGIMQAVAELRPAVNIIGAVASTENMPGGKAYKPGDILRAYNGKTIEVLNTDAEGRLALADALSYVVEEFAPDVMVNFATLTGAAIVALGHRASAIMGNHQALVDQIVAAGEYTGERCWQLPLWDDYSGDIKSDVADIQNIGNQGAGTITAGAFLKEFVGETHWAHLDIAGTAWWSEDQPYIPKGASGVGVRLIIRWLEQNLMG